MKWVSWKGSEAEEEAALAGCAGVEDDVFLWVASEADFLAEEEDIAENFLRNHNVSRVFFVHFQTKTVKYVALWAMGT